MKLRNFVESLSPLKAGVFAFVFICAVHVAYAVFLAVDVPMWDQWDAEGEWYKRLVDKSYDLQSLIAPPNEHRIAFTGLFNGALFTLAGGWSLLLGIYMQIPLIGLAFALLCSWLVQYANGRRFAAIVFTLIAFSLRFSWANILSSFQNQFYFMLLFAVVSIYLVATSKNSITLFLAVAPALLSPFTMAGSVGTVAVVWGLFFLRLFEVRKQRIFNALLLVVLSVGLVMHLQILVHVPGHDRLHAQNFSEFMISFLKILDWPEIPFGFLVWSAIGLALLRWIRVNGGIFRSINLLTAPQRLALGLIAWYVFQAAATAYSRTRTDLMSSRYQQNFSLVIPIAFITMGIFGFAFRRETVLRVAYVFHPLGLLVRTYRELPYLQKYHGETLFNRTAIAEAVQKNSLSLLKASDREGKLGYFTADRIWEQIFDARLRSRQLWLKD